MRKLILSLVVAGSLVIPFAGIASADLPGEQVNNPNANGNACWGQDRAYYASQGFFPQNMDIKQSFPPANGKVGAQRAAWVATYCAPHGPQN